jgi:hypothetical protein
MIYLSIFFVRFQLDDINGSRCIFEKATAVIYGQRTRAYSRDSTTANLNIVLSLGSPTPDG